MGLFADAASTAIGAIRGVDSSVVPTCTYTRVTAGSYNATTGGVSKTTSTSTTAAIFSAYSAEERRDSTIQANDQKALIASQALSFAPAINDTLTKPDGSVWTIVAVGTDPATALWVLQVRRPD